MHLRIVIRTVPGGARGSENGCSVNRAFVPAMLDAVDWMYRHAERVIYPSRDQTRRAPGGERQA